VEKSWKWTNSGKVGKNSQSLEKTKQNTMKLISTEEPEGAPHGYLMRTGCGNKAEETLEMLNSAAVAPGNWNYANVVSIRL